MFIRIINRHLRRSVQFITKMDASAYQNMNQTSEIETTQALDVDLSNPNVDLDSMSIKEGKATIRLRTDKVFYNPVQEFNRDLSIAVLSVFSTDYYEERYVKEQEKKAKSEAAGLPVQELDSSKYLVTILEPLSATGLRAIRYAKEVPNVLKVVANDLSRAAVEVIKENIIYNEVLDRIEANHDDACMVMYKHKSKDERFTAIDLDPYGSPTMFLDSAVQAVSDGGLLLVTATDMAVLAGNSPETCYVKYGAISLKTKSCHEMALRILLQCIEAHANRYGRYIEPMLSISVDFYIRVFVKIHTGLAKCKLTTSKLSMVHHCTGCGNLVLQPLGGVRPNPTDKNPLQVKNFLPTGPPLGPNCVHCNSKHHLGGPIWSGPLHNTPFVERALAHVLKYPNNFGTAKRLVGVLSVVKEEIEEPLYYTTDNLFGRMHLEVMKMIMLRSAILNAGYRVSYSHACKNSIKTDAPADLLWDIVRTWEKDHPVKPAKIESDLVARAILTQKPKNVIDLTVTPDANPVSRRDGCLRFQFNPAPFWGPGAKSHINVGDRTYQKAVSNQSRKNYGKDERNSQKRQASPDTGEARKKYNEHRSDSGDISVENK